MEEKIKNCIKLLETTLGDMSAKDADEIVRVAISILKSKK